MATEITLVQLDLSGQRRRFRSHPPGNDFSELAKVQRRRVTIHATRSAAARAPQTDGSRPPEYYAEVCFFVAS